MRRSVGPTIAQNLRPNITVVIIRCCCYCYVACVKVAKVRAVSVECFCSIGILCADLWFVSIVFKNVEMCG